jgi:hypothetical protein
LPENRAKIGVVGVPFQGQNTGSNPVGDEPFRINSFARFSRTRFCQLGARVSVDSAFSIRLLRRFFGWSLDSLLHHSLHRRHCSLSFGITDVSRVTPAPEHMHVFHALRS